MRNIKRKLFEDLKKHVSAKEISLITGPRQVGKTTLMLRLQDFLVKQGQKTILLNLDIEKDKTYFQSQEALLNKLKLEFGRHKAYIFIDEMQRKENAGIFLKGLYDSNLPYKFIVSGSGSLELKEKIHESLAGRKRLFELNPVSFYEFIDYKTDYQYSARLPDFFSIENDATSQWLDEYLNYGGYPQVILAETKEEKNQIINELYKSYLERDVAYLLNIDKTDSFAKIVKILAGQAGQLVNISALARQSGLSQPTVNKYLWYIEKTFIVYFLSPYFINRVREITKAKTAYFFDLGLRNFSIGLFGNLVDAKNKSFAFQNLIGNMLLHKIRWSGQVLRFWRTLDNAEVDFIIEQGTAAIPVEVKYSCLKKPEMTRSLRNYIANNKPKEAWVINLSLKQTIQIYSTVVKFLPYYDV